jgi:hypothetical protein
MYRTPALTLALLLVGIPQAAFGQLEHACIKEFVAGRARGGSLGIASTEAERIVADVAGSIGLRRPITIVPCHFAEKASASSPNGVAGVPAGEYIVYNPDWVREVLGKDKVQAIALFGHELGHFLNGDFTVRRNVPRAVQERDADHFAGCAVARLSGNFEALENLLSRLRRDTDPLYPNRLQSISSARAGFEACARSTAGLPIIGGSSSEPAREKLFSALGGGRGQLSAAVPSIQWKDESGMLVGSYDAKYLGWPSKHRYLTDKDGKIFRIEIVVQATSVVRDGKEEREARPLVDDACRKMKGEFESLRTGQSVPVQGWPSRAYERARWERLFDEARDYGQAFCRGSSTTACVTSSDARQGYLNEIQLQRIHAPMFGTEAVQVELELQQNPILFGTQGRPDDSWPMVGFRKLCKLSLKQPAVD